jgi:S1-C subfamily serine protease
LQGYQGQIGPFGIDAAEMYPLKMRVLKSFAAFLCMCFAVSASAKLGETVPQIIKRFGKSYTIESFLPKAEDFLDGKADASGKNYRFRSENVSVDVLILDGVSVAETYFSDHPLTASGEPPNDIVHAVLKTNVPKARWVEIEATPFRADYALRSSDGQYVAILKYTGPQPENMIWTITVGTAGVVNSISASTPSPSSPIATILVTPAPTASAPTISAPPVIIASPTPVPGIDSALNRLTGSNIAKVIVYAYFFAAVIVSICAAQLLQKRLKRQSPETRPYRWGYYFGCSNLACAPIAFLFACLAVIFAAYEKPEAVGEYSVYAIYLGFLAICGWFIVKRRWWAWVCGTIFSFNIVLWMINGVYGSRRRTELSKKSRIEVTPARQPEPVLSPTPPASQNTVAVSGSERAPARKTAALLFVLCATFLCTIVVMYFRPWAQQEASNRETRRVFNPLVDLKPLPLPELVKLIRPSVVEILGYKHGQFQQAGSGFFVGKSGDIVTNFHVIDGVDGAILKLSNGATYEVIDVLNYSQGADIAILETFATGPKPLPLSTNLPEVGERIYVLGNPATLEGSLSDGLVSARRRDDYGAFVQISAPISHGSSGSPVFNGWGVVVGIATMAFEPGQNLNFARGAGTIRAMLDSSSSPIQFNQLEQRLIAEQKQVFDADSDKYAASAALRRKDWAAAVVALTKLSKKYRRLDFIKEDLSEALAHRALEFAIAGDYNTAIQVARLAVEVRDTKYARDTLQLISKGAAMR